MAEKKTNPTLAELRAQLAAMQAQLAAANAAAEAAKQEAAAAKAAAAAGKKSRAPKSHADLMASSAWYRTGYAAAAIDPAIVTGSDAYGRAAGRSLALMYATDPGDLAGGNIRQYVARSANVLAGYLAAESQTAAPDTIRRYQALLTEFDRHTTDASLTAEQIDYARRMPAIAATQAAVQAAKQDAATNDTQPEVAE